MCHLKITREALKTPKAVNEFLIVLAAGALLLMGGDLKAQNASLNAETVEVAPKLPRPDNRYKADILLIVAHPDDDTGVLNYITRASLDEHRRVAVIFSTRGNSGGNAAGMEQSKAMADEREMEARRSLAASGIENVWFLHGSDTATQDVLHSLETLGHGEALDEVVRLVRLTRPEVILTWMPAYVAGENHGDHQASSVVATEAFDLSGDPTVFPEQINAPKRYYSINNYGEGLHPWQAKKLYFFSDASHQEFLAHHGPTYLATDISKSKELSYAVLNKKAWQLYATQIDPLLDYYANMPDYLILGKTHVKITSPEADVWDGIDDKPIGYVAAPGYHPESHGAVSLELGGPWAFYKQFQKAHGVASSLSFVKPQTAFSSDSSLWVPLLIHNDSDQARDLVLKSAFGEGWLPIKDTLYHVEAHSSYPAQLFLARTAPLPPSAAITQTPSSVIPVTPTQDLHWTLSEGGKSVGDVTLTVYLEYNGVPQ
jgi:LmbE family N-acetylglucosaminyl deacetylase